MHARSLDVKTSLLTKLVLLPATFLLFSSIPANAQQTLPDTIWIPVTFYDYHADGSNPEFNPDHVGGLYPGMVDATLDADKKPVRTTNLSSIFFNYYIGKWFRPWEPEDYTVPQYAAGGTGRYVQTITLNHDTSFKNVVIQDSLPFTLVPNSGGLYQFYDSTFFMLDNRGFGNEPFNTANNPDNHNYSYAMELHTSFTYQPNLRFDFAGDDDVWAFINNQLALDLGGIHTTMTGSIDLNTLTGLQAGYNYNFDFFYCERHTTKSVIRITTNLFTPMSYLRLYPNPGTPDVSGNAPYNASDTASAGTPVNLHAHVFDSMFVWQPSYDDQVVWTITDASGTVILTDTAGASNSFLPTEAYGNVTITATFRDPNNPNAAPATAIVQFYIAPGAPHHVDLIQGTQVQNYNDNENLSQITIDENRTRDSVYAVVRDSLGNFVRFANSAQWDTRNSTIAGVTGTYQKLYEGVVTKRGSGTAVIVVTETGLVPDTLSVACVVVQSTLVRAVTRDVDGDGYLDRIVCTFDSLVTLAGPLAGLSVKTGSVTFTVDSVRGAGGTVDSVFTVYLAEYRSGDLQTGWLPTITATAFGDAAPMSGFVCSDGAAPVIRRVLYYPAPLRGQGAPQAFDTLRVTLSEPVRWVLSDATPSQTFYYIDAAAHNPAALSGIGAADMERGQTTARILMTNGFVIQPLIDSMKLDWQTLVLVDTAGNLVQGNNRTVPIEWGVDNSMQLIPLNNPVVTGPGGTALPAVVQVYYGNVISSSGGSVNSRTPGSIIGIQSLKPLRQQTDGAYGSAIVYDAVGNVVKENVRVDRAAGASDYGMFWDGRNSHGRFVGGGTYLFVVTAEDMDGGKLLKRVKIGIKR